MGAWVETPLWRANRFSWVLIATLSTLLPGSAVLKRKDSNFESACNVLEFRGSTRRKNCPEVRTLRTSASSNCLMYGFDIGSRLGFNSHLVAGLKVVGWQRIILPDQYHVPLLDLGVDRPAVFIGGAYEFLTQLGFVHSNPKRMSSPVVGQIAPCVNS